LNQIGIFLRIYLNPLRAFGRVIDEGRLAFAVGLALLAMFAVQAPRDAVIDGHAAAARRYLKEHPAPPAPEAETAAEDDEDSGDSRNISSGASTIPRASAGTDA
jgi:hypothetical protein